jgi:hypothetical protein
MMIAFDYLVIFNTILWKILIKNGESKKRPKLAAYSLYNIRLS